MPNVKPIQDGPATYPVITGPFTVLQNVAPEGRASSTDRYTSASNRSTYSASTPNVVSTASGCVMSTPASLSASSG